MTSTASVPFTEYCGVPGGWATTMAPSVEMMVVVFIFVLILCPPICCGCIAPPSLRTCPATFTFATLLKSRSLFALPARLPRPGLSRPLLSVLELLFFPLPSSSLLVSSSLSILRSCWLCVYCETLLRRTLSGPGDTSFSFFTEAEVLRM